MKITPLELRQYSFEKTFRGYSIEEVDMFLNNLSQEWERLLNDTKMLRMQLELAEKEAHKLREIEFTLFKTLKTAEDTSNMITEQATQQAEKNISEATEKAETIVAEANLKAEKLVNDAQEKANQLISSAQEKATYIKEDILSDVQALERDFKTMQHYKDNLLVQMRSLASATITHVERFEGKFDAAAFEDKFDKANHVIANEIAPFEKPTNQEMEADEMQEADVFSPHEQLSEVEEELAVQETGVENSTLNDILHSAPEHPVIDTNETDIHPIPDVEETHHEHELIVESEFVHEPVIDNRPSEVTTEIVQPEEILVNETIHTPDEIEIPSEEEFTVSKEEPASFQQKIAAIKQSLQETEAAPQPEEVVNETEVYEEEPPAVAVMSSSVNQLASEEIPSSTPAPDDLEIIEGIGPKAKEVLNNNNIFTFRDLAITPGYKIRYYLEDSGYNFSLIDPTSWTEQALLAAEGRWDDLRKRQEELVAGREPAVPTQPVAASTPPPPPPPAPSRPVNHEDITEDMLERVNRVKSAIRKAMVEKGDKPEDKKKDDGYVPTVNDIINKNRKPGSGSFFDNVE